jgi:hypothetical protein
LKPQIGSVQNRTEREAQGSGGGVFPATGVD